MIKAIQLSQTKPKRQSHIYYVQLAKIIIHEQSWLWMHENIQITDV